jgi:hypothetical protein
MRAGFTQIMLCVDRMTATACMLLPCGNIIHVQKKKENLLLDMPSDGSLLANMQNLTICW